MNVTDIFIRKPVIAISLNSLILLAGFQAIQTLSVRQYPKSDSAAITVTTAYVGASAELVRGFITTPLERAIATMDGIDYMESSSVQGFSRIKVNLLLNYDVNAALTQIQSKVAQVRNELPAEAEAPVINVESRDTQFASMYLSFYSDELGSNEITDYLSRVVQPRLNTIKGVQRAEILGRRTFAMRVWLKPDRMAALGISPSEVRAALAANNTLAAVGSTKGSMVQMNLVANTDLRTPEEFEQLVVRERNDTVVRLRDIAEVELGAESYDDEVRFGDKAATFIGIYVLPTANSLEVIRAVRAELPAIEAELPSGIRLNISYDATEYIQDALTEVLKTLAETIGIVILVIFLFIGSFRSVTVPVVAIPLSLIGACALMWFLGFTLNLLTILALVLAVGIVVDDAIVMLENVERHFHEGKSPLEAGLVAARELARPVFSMTIILAAVYVPVGLQGGLTGALFREFAFTLAGAVLISGVVAITLSPMMASRFLRSDQGEPVIARAVNQVFAKLRNRYERVLEVSLRNQPVVLVLALGLSLLWVPLGMFSTKELAPREDQGVLFCVLQAAPDASLEQTSLFAFKLEELYRSYPECAITFHVINPTGGFSGMVLKPWGQRARTAMELEDDAFHRFAVIPGIRVVPLTPPPLPGGSDFPVEVVIGTTDEADRLYPVAAELLGHARGSGMFTYVDMDLKYDLPQAEVVLDRDKIASMGVSLRQVSEDLGVLLGGNYVNRFNIQGRSYKVIPQAKRGSRLHPWQLKEYYVTGPQGTLIPLGTVARLEERVEPRSLNRFQQLNAAKIQGALPPGVSLDQALRVIEEKAATVLPKGYTLDYAGESRQLRREGDKFTGMFVLALVMVYLILAVQFESFRDPLIVLFGSVPLALTGALLMPFLGVKETTLNIYTQVGLITLVGLIAKNGILIVEFANELQRRGLGKMEAVLRASGIRLRPILMTSFATVFGHMPLVFVTGAGAAARNNIGVVLVAGMAIGTVFTLFIVPAIYLWIGRKLNQIPNSA
jgi:multidrug efflux pump